MVVGPYTKLKVMYTPGTCTERRLLHTRDQKTAQRYTTPEPGYMYMYQYT